MGDELHLRFPPDRPSHGPRRADRATRRQDGRLPVGDPARPATKIGHASSGLTSTKSSVTSRQAGAKAAWSSSGGAGRSRSRAATSSSRPSRRRPELDDDRPRGDLRPGDLDDPSTPRRGDPPRNETSYGLAGVALHDDLDTAFRLARSIKAARSRSTVFEGESRRRSVATSSRASAAATRASRRSTSTREKTIWVTLREN